MPSTTRMSADASDSTPIRTCATPPPVPQEYDTQIEHSGVMFEATRNYIANFVMYIACWGRSENNPVTPPDTPPPESPDAVEPRGDEEAVAPVEVKRETPDISANLQEALRSSKGKQRETGRQSVQQREEIMEFIRDVIIHLPLDPDDIVHARQQMLKKLLCRAITNPIHVREHIQQSHEAPALAPQPIQLINPDGTSKDIPQDTTSRRATRKSNRQAQKPYVLKVRPPKPAKDEPALPFPMCPFSVKFMPDAANIPGRILRVDENGKITMGELPRAPPVTTVPPITGPAPPTGAGAAVQIPVPTPPVTTFSSSTPHLPVSLPKADTKPQAKAPASAGVPRHYPAPLANPLPSTSVFGPGPDRDGANHFPSSFHTPMSRPTVLGTSGATTPSNGGGSALRRTYTFYDQSHPEVFWDKAGWGKSPCAPPDAPPATPTPRHDHAVSWVPPPFPLRLIPPRAKLLRRQMHGPLSVCAASPLG
ncbi:hypothetical protein BD779DRAFT_1545702 [Infundibulicybe gibba]|nr:hypothetical protein BD779DRAFT_1545702 [Infundibulicybe gibba]